MMRIPGWLLCCSGQFRCNGAWNEAAGKIRYSSSTFVTEKYVNWIVLLWVRFIWENLSQNHVLKMGVSSWHCHRHVLNLFEKICHRFLSWKEGRFGTKLFQKICHIPACFEWRVSCIKLIWVLLSVQQVQLQFHFRRENSFQFKAKPVHNTVYTIQS